MENGHGAFSTRVHACARCGATPLRCQPPEPSDDADKTAPCPRAAQPGAWPALSATRCAHTKMADRRKAKGEAVRLPLEGIVLCSSSADGLVVLVCSPAGPQGPWFQMEPRNKRIILVADAACPRGPTGSGAALHGSFVVLAPVERNLWATPLQKNQFATSPSCCFCYSGAASFCSCYGCFWFFVFVVPVIEQQSCQLYESLLYQ